MKFLRGLWFSGRARRSTFWLVLSPLLLVGVSLAVPSLSLLKLLPHLPVDASILIFAVYVLSPIYGFIALVYGVKRLHDRGKPGWRLHLLFYPLIFSVAVYVVHSLGVDIPLGFLLNGSKGAELISGVAAIWFLIELGFFPGTKGENKYGPDPRETSFT